MRVWAIALAGLALWGAIDLAVWWLTPALLPSARSLDGAVRQVTSERGIEALPALSPDGAWIAYRSDAEGTGDIYVRRVGDDEGRNLTRDLRAEESDPAFSPDGRRIAFRSTYQNGGIYIIDRGGGSPRRVTNFGASPAWTPNGRAIVFATRSGVDPLAGIPLGTGYVPSGLHSGASQGWIVNVESRVVSRVSGGDFRQPAVSPDGKRVAYWSAPSAPGSSRRGRGAGIWIASFVGGDPRQATPGASGAIDWSPVWSSDGEFLYFLSNRGGAVGMWRVAANPALSPARNEPVRMAFDVERAAALTIAANGRHLAWSTAEAMPALLRIDYHADTRTARGQPTSVRTGFLPLRCAEPSPDGAVFAIASDRQQSDVFLVDAGGGTPRAVTSDTAIEGCPRWSPDGSRVAFHSNEGGLNRIWIADANGLGARPFAAAPLELTHPVWSPDGAAIAAREAGHGALRILHLAAAGAPRARDASVLPPPGGFIPVSWSPDGTQIAGTAAGAVWTYAVASQHYERIMPGSGPTWLSTSRRIVLAAEGRLLLVDVPTKFVRELLTLPDAHFDAPLLSPDDRTLYFSRNAPEANIWMGTLR